MTKPMLVLPDESFTPRTVGSGLKPDKSGFKPDPTVRTYTGDLHSFFSPQNVIAKNRIKTGLN